MSAPADHPRPRSPRGDQPSPRMSGGDAYLLDVRAAIDDAAEQVRDQAIPRIDSDPGVAGGPIDPLDRPPPAAPPRRSPPSQSQRSRGRPRARFRAGLQAQSAGPGE